MNRLLEILKGGQGSGNFGHEGRPGEVGGSSSGLSSQRLTPEDSQALKNYSGTSGYLYANGVLRGNPNLGTRQKEQGQELVRQMDQAFKNSPDETGEEKTVYRGIALDRLPGGPEQIIGQEVLVDSYMSVSTQRSVANGFPQGRKPIGRARLDIKVPPGTRYIDVMRHSQHPEENEWLFNRGSRLKITGASKREIIPPAWVLEAELIPSSLSKSSEVLGTDWFDDDWLHYPSYRPNDRLLKILKGGMGSGNFGHEGRPGEVGGSSERNLVHSRAQSFVQKNLSQIVSTTVIGTSADGAPILTSRFQEQEKIDALRVEFLKSEGYQDSEIDRLDGMTKDWAQGPHLPEAVSMRQAASAELGRSFDSDYNFRDPELTGTPADLERDRQILLAQKAFTQAALTEAVKTRNMEDLQLDNHGDLVVRRFVGGQQSREIKSLLETGHKEIDLGMNSLSSWAAGEGVWNYARDNSGVIIEHSIPIHSIWNFGSFNRHMIQSEKEAIVGSRVKNVRIHASQIKIKGGLFKSRRSLNVPLVALDADPKNSNWLRAYSRSSTLSKLLRLLKGGEGSGNFGHEGRPGEIGGSSSGSSSEQHYDHLMEGARGSLDFAHGYVSVRSYGRLVPIMEHSVKSLEGALRYAHLLDYEPESLGKARQSLSVAKSNFHEAQKPSHRTDRQEVYKESIQLLEQTYVLIRHSQPVVKKKNRDVLKGGSGSGNFGHVGRPGERGGSGSGAGSREGKRFGNVADAKKLSEKMGIPIDVADKLLRMNLVGVHLKEPPRAEPTETEARYTQPGKNFSGKCYDKAADYFLNHQQEGVALVHGTISDGILTIGHAWVELPSGKVFDGTQQAFYRKEDYYKSHLAKAERVYHGDQVYKNMDKYRHYGPWHTGAGFVRGEKGRKEE